MTTTLLQSRRGDEVSEIAQSAGSAIAGDIHVIYEDEISKQELVTGLERILNQIHQVDVPRP